jgi:hypothetical protein
MRWFVPENLAMLVITCLSPCEVADLSPKVLMILVIVDRAYEYRLAVLMMDLKLLPEQIIKLSSVRWKYWKSYNSDKESYIATIE